MTGPNSLAVFGGRQLFTQPLRPGQRFLPDRASYETLFRDIFERQYYTNQGPLVKRLEERLADYIGVRHAICMTNEFVGLISLTYALGMRGRVVVPATCSRAMREALRWTAVEPVYCDVDDATGLMTATLVEQALDRWEASAVFALNPWGDACPIVDLEALAAVRSVVLYVDSSQGFGCTIDDKRLGSYGKADIISLHSDNVLSTLEGCVVCTNDDDISAYLRNMRSSYGMGRPFPVPRTTNGRMSEAQAALGLFGLDRLGERIARNRDQFMAFQAGIDGIPGLSVRMPRGVRLTNHQNLICLVDESDFGLNRDSLIRALRAENVVARPAISTPSLASTNSSSTIVPDPLPNAAYYAVHAIELPIGAAVVDSDIVRIAERIRLIQSSAKSIAGLFADRA